MGKLSGNSDKLPKSLIAAWLYCARLVNQQRQKSTNKSKPLANFKTSKSFRFIIKSQKYIFTARNAPLNGVQFEHKYAGKPVSNWKNLLLWIIQIIRQITEAFDCRGTYFIRPENWLISNSPKAVFTTTNKVISETIKWCRIWIIYHETTSSH